MDRTVLQKSLVVSSRRLMWVKGHAGIAGNEVADRKASLQGADWHVPRSDHARRHQTRIPNPPQTQAPRTVKGLTYIVTDKGPLRSWLKIIGRRDDDRRDCGSIQNAVHLMRCPVVGDGKGRIEEEVWSDQEWCRAVADFLA